MTLYNINKHKGLRRLLRRKMTAAETKMWCDLRRKALGYKFRRQYGIGPYIVDFYCPQLKLAIELDGDVHALEYNIQRDKIRDKYLKNLGVLVKRYWNHEVYENIDGVIEEIVLICNDLNSRNLQVCCEDLVSPSKIRGRFRGS